MTNPRSHRFRAILFDLYDTLIWLDVQRSNMWRQRLADRAGVPLNVFMRAWRRSIDDRMLGRGSGLAGHLAETLESLGVPASPILVTELIDIERRRLEECVHLYSSAEPVLRELSRRGYKLGLVSNISDGAAVPIPHLGLDRLFDEMILSYQVGLLKPDPAIFEVACRRLNAVPSEAAFVADGGFGELDASRRLGIFSILVEQDYQSKDYGSSTEYDLKVSDLEELLAIFPPLASTNG